MNKKVLFISNGYAEDQVALAIIRELKKISPNTQITAFPIVGDAKHFSGAKVIGPHWELPSQGVCVGIVNILKDILAGAIFLYLGQLISLFRNRSKFDLVVGVGDYVSIIYSGLTLKKPFMFVWSCPTPEFPKKSKKYLSKYGVVAFPLMKEYKHLDDAGIKTEYVGNPTLDAPEITGDDLGLDKSKKTLGILPGSRDYIFEEIPIIMEVISRAKEKKDMNIAVGLSLKQDPEKYRSIAKRHKGYSDDIIITQKFGDVLQNSVVILGLGGASSETAAGMGKPIVTFWGKEGTRRSREMVTAHINTILKDSAILVPPDPAKVSGEIIALLENPEKMKKMSERGRQIMGEPGASKRIAERINDFLLKEKT